MIYLAAPYSHDDPAVRQQRFERINRVAARLMSDGARLFSPISHTHPICLAGRLPTGWDYWERYDRTILDACDALLVLMLDGWKESTGVAAEIDIADELGLPVSWLQPLPHEVAA